MLSWLHAVESLTSLSKNGFCWKVAGHSDNSKQQDQRGPLAVRPRAAVSVSPSQVSLLFSLQTCVILSQSLTSVSYEWPMLLASSESVFVPIPKFPEQESVPLVHLFEPYVCPWITDLRSGLINSWKWNGIG